MASWANGIDAWVHPESMHFIADRMRREGNASVPAVSVYEGSLYRGRLHVDGAVDEEARLRVTVYFKDDMAHADPEESIRWMIDNPKSWMLEEGSSISFKPPSVCRLILQSDVFSDKIISGTLMFSTTQEGDA